MNIFTVWSLPTATQRRSGPRRAQAARGLRTKCTTWKSLKNHWETLCFQCAPQVHRCCHHSVLRSWDWAWVAPVTCELAGKLIGKLIKNH